MSKWDEMNKAAVHLCWICCRREVFSTHPQFGCMDCMGYLRSIAIVPRHVPYPSAPQQTTCIPCRGRS